jgi:predicted transposase YbfD/YdcC
MAALDSVSGGAMEDATRDYAADSIENSLHRVLDMIFRDDECRVRTDHAPANFATIRLMAHNLVRKAPGKTSLRLKRKAAGWDDDFLAQLIAR